MANTQPARLTFNVIDGLGTKASITTYALLDPAMTVAQLETAWAAQATALDAMLDVQITGGGSEVIPTHAQVAAAVAKTSPVSTSRVEQTGVFDLNNATTTRVFGIAVAGLANAVISAGKILITEDGPVDVWLDIIEETGSASLPQYTNTSQQSLTTLRDAFLSFRKRRKQLDRSSRELGPD